MMTTRSLKITHPWTTDTDFDRDVNEKIKEDRRQFDQRVREIDASFERPPRYWMSTIFEEQQPGERRSSISRQLAEMKELPDKYHWSLDVKEFAPEELKVSVVGNTLTVEGNRDEIKDKDGYHSKKSHHFSRKYTLPPTTDMQAIETTLSTTGQLIIEAPKREQRKIPVDFKSIHG